MIIPLVPNHFGMVNPFSAPFVTASLSLQNPHSNSSASTSIYPGVVMESTSDLRNDSTSVRCVEETTRLYLGTQNAPEYLMESSVFEFPSPNSSAPSNAPKASSNPFKLSPHPDIHYTDFSDTIHARLPFSNSSLSDNEIYTRVTQHQEKKTLLLCPTLAI